MQGVQGGGPVDLRQGGHDREEDVHPLLAPHHGVIVQLPGLQAAVSTTLPIILFHVYLILDFFIPVTILR